MTKKILVIAESIEEEDSSGTKGRVALIKNLNTLGFKIRVLHYSLKEIHLEGIECIAIKENRRSFYFFLSRLERQIRYKLKIHLSGLIEKCFGFSFTLINDRNSIVSEVKKNVDFQPDLVITLSKGGSFRTHHALLQIPELHYKWLAYIHDPYPMHYYPPPYAYKEPGFKTKENFIHKVFKDARYLGFPSKLLQEWMGRFIEESMEKGIIIPHQITRFKNQNVVFPDYFNPEKFNILHAGNLLWGRDPMGLIEGYRKFMTNNLSAKNNSQLIFLGNKNFYTDKLNTIKKEIPEIYVSDGYVGYSNVLKMQNSSSINIILEAKSEISPFLPGKFPHCIQAEKPILVLGPHNSEVMRLLGKDYSYWSEIDNSEKIAEKLAEIYRIWSESKSVSLDRKDLKEYLSQNYLNQVIRSLFN